MGKRTGIMLATKFEDRFITDWKGLFVQPKINGLRCRAVCNKDGVILYSSEGNVINSVPHINSIFDKSIKEAFGGGEVFDGELYIPGYRTTQRLFSIVNRKGVHPDHEEVQYHIFDLIVSQTVQYHRIVALGYLHNVLLHYDREACRKSIKLVDTYLLSLEKYHKDRKIILSSMCRLGYEGIILRNIDGLYEEKRSRNLLKIKPTLKGMFTIMDVTEAINIEGIPKDMLGAFICSDPEGNTFKVGTGFTEEERIKYWNDKNDYIGLYAIVKYAYITDRGVPYHPVFVRLVK